MTHFTKILNENLASQVYTFKDVLDAKTPERLTEASLGRIYQHVMSMKNTQSWMIMSASLDSNTPQQNNEKTKQLKQDIRRLNLGFFPLEGYGQEPDDNGDIQVVKEESVFVINIDLKQSMKLMKKFHQFGIVYSGPETDHKIELIEQDGSKTNLGSFRPMKIAQFFSKVKGKSFTFESVASSNMERLYAAKHPRQPIKGVDYV